MSYTESSIPLNVVDVALVSGECLLLRVAFTSIWRMYLWPQGVSCTESSIPLNLENVAVGPSDYLLLRRAAFCHVVL